MPFGHSFVRGAIGPCQEVIYQHENLEVTAMRYPFFALAALASISTSARALELDLPLACTIGTDCWVQQYPDHDVGPGSTDYTCGTATYDGHDGTDIRVRDTQSEVQVLAAAEGAVKAIRNNMDDRLLEKLSDVKTVECGNGVVIVHPGGFETQYCHMRKGSVGVRAGERVKRGQPLGLVGYSGAAAFPHVHLSVRKAGQKIDPFSGALAQDCAATDQSMWSKKAQVALFYQPTTLLEFGWSQGKVDSAALATGQVVRDAPRNDWPALVAYAWLINLQKGDVVTLTMKANTGKASTGEPAVNTVTLDRDKAQYVLFAGKKRTAAWSGSYSATLTVSAGSVSAGGKEKLRREIEVKIE
jgi:Peptidase family M23